MRLCVLLRCAKLTAISNNTLIFSPRHCQHKHTHARRVFASSFSTGPPGDRGALHCLWNVIATQPIGLVWFQARGILPVAEEQSRTRGDQSGRVTDQPQCRGLWHSSSPNVRSLSHSPSSPPPSFTQYVLPQLNLLHEVFKRSQVSPPAFSSSQGQQPTRPAPFRRNAVSRCSSPSNGLNSGLAVSTTRARVLRSSASSTCLRSTRPLPPESLLALR